MGAAGSWDRRNNELLGSMSGYLQLISGVSDTPMIIASGNVASAAAVVTVPPVAGKIALLVGFLVSGLGATAAAAVTVTVEGVSADPIEFAYVAKAGATVPNDDLAINFPFPVAATDDETDIVITCPDLGDGNTHNQVTAFVVYRDSGVLADDDTPIVATSGNVANAAATATIPAIDGKIAHLSGFRVQGLGATAGSTKNVTIAGVAGDDLSYPVVVATGAAVANADVDERYPFGLPATDDQTDIVITCPALGAGNTNNQVVAFGFYRDA